ncbi:MAG: site-specific DNA-methyltransferase [Bacilli bacterium]|nr:site-specific DNA-methyltransferase [Bacilli bacterium]
MANKLELTWYGKENEIKVEPRILIEDKNLSYSRETTGLFNEATFDNILIHGDNLLALKALEKDYTGKIKCIYIDPPYNTGSAFEHYDDNLEHSIWLSLLKPRIEILYNLLSPDGLLFVQIDDNEQAYLTVMLDEIFGRTNRVNTICVKMSEPTGVKMAHVKKRMPKMKEYLLVYKKENIDLNIVKIPKDKWDEEYKLVMLGISQKDIEYVKEVMNNEEVQSEDIYKADSLLKNVTFMSIDEVMRMEGIAINKDNKNKFRYNNAFRIVRDVATTGGSKKIADEKRKTTLNNAFLIKTPKNKIYLIKNGYNLSSEQPRIKLLFADDYLMQNPGDLWTDISTTGLESEGGVVFKKSKKPERLIQRCIEISSKPGDWVLDSFLGSGTTCAVAHKMKRRWIGIEMGEQAYTHCKVRLDKIIEGTEQGGITKEVNWQNGGGYKFYELAPSLVNIDSLGEPVINKEYNADMLASAVALHEGFKYSPDTKCFWKQSKSNENSYLFVTTNIVTDALVKEIVSQMADDEFLIIACKSFEKSAVNISDKIKIKKIPQMLLGKCEFGKDNYNLNIINPPVYEDEEDEDNE